MKNIVTIAIAIILTATASFAEDIYYKCDRIDGKVSSEFYTSFHGMTRTDDQTVYVWNPKRKKWDNLGTYLQKGTNMSMSFKHIGLYRQFNFDAKTGYATSMATRGGKQYTAVYQCGVSANKPAQKTTQKVNTSWLSEVLNDVIVAGVQSYSGYYASDNYTSQYNQIQTQRLNSQIQWQNEAIRQMNNGTYHRWGNRNQVW